MANYIRAQIGVIKTKNTDMANVLFSAEAAAQSPMNIMICGETGSGRDTLAEAIHYMSGKKDEIMYGVLCGGESGEDIEALVPGLIYLDEVHRLPKRLQKKLLIKLKDNGDKMRVISSVDRSVDDMLSRGLFYRDLYYLLAAIRLDVPGLRQRGQDISMIVRDLISKYCRKYQKQVRIESGAMKLLKYYRYPGNIAELDCIIQRAVLINSGGIIRTNSIMSILDMENVVFASLIKGSNLEYQKEMDRLSRELIINALRDTGSMRKAASQLGLSHSTLWDKCGSLGLSVTDYTGK